MLVLARQLGQQIRIGEDVVITITQIIPTVVKVGIEAPRELRVMRQELLDRQDNLPSPLPPPV